MTTSETPEEEIADRLLIENESKLLGVIAVCSYAIIISTIIGCFLWWNWESIEKVIKLK